MPAATCFFCYAWNKENKEKEKERYGRLDHLRKRVEEGSNNRVKVILDKHDYQDNVDFKKERRKIWTYDLVVVMCTPDLKAIFDSDDGLSYDDDKLNGERELRKEYRILRERYKKNTNSLFPVILEGDIESSLPNLFTGRNARIYENFRIKRNTHGQYSVPSTSRNEFVRFIKRITSNALDNQWKKSREYETVQESFDNLFYLTDRTDIPDECLITPRIYNTIRSQATILVIGRKGSGKSTLIKNFCRMDTVYWERNFMDFINFAADNIDFEPIYSLLYKDHLQDRNVIDPYKLFCLFWRVFIFFHCLIVIRAEIENDKIKDIDKRYKVFDKVTKCLLRRIGLKIGGKYESVKNQKNIHESLITAAIEAINTRFQTAFDEMDENDSKNSIITMYQSKFSLQSVVKAFLQITNKDTYSLVTALEDCERKVLVPLDGFNTHSVDFHKDTEKYDHRTDEYRNRNEFELLLFRTLVEVATQLRDREGFDPLTSALSEITNFCIILPKDRYDKIKEADRDCFKKKVGSLSWSIRDLLEIVVRRLEYLELQQNDAYKIDESANLISRMNAVLQAMEIPTSISMKVGGNIMSMSLYNYILRSTFWRPRDIISHMSVILASNFRIVNNKMIKLNSTVSEDNIRLPVKSNADKIIEEEFFQEYEDTFYNIREVFKSFQGLDEQMSVINFQNIIKSVQFATSFIYDMNLIENKMRVLYQLGVIGLYYNNELKERNHYRDRICFKFNSGMTPFYDFLRMNIVDDKEIQILFNPLFSRNLGLKYNTKELIGNWSDDYINGPILPIDDE